ncbi:MAG: hypothetical protein H6708_17680 [Kofleriaceae bacterium]|nr:hypothetical protein [Myxococcales bacterium]MCB9562239.1 hypothetical protein [Kofleriaceae bacterium]
MAGKPHLYELLAVEQEKKANAERARAQTLEGFRQNQAHFQGLRRTFKPFAVDEAKGEVAGERLEAETQLARTVAEELDKTLALTADAFDVSYLIDEGNTVARADLVVGGKVIAEQLPATFLLQLEKRLREVRLLFKDIPTFDPVRNWVPDATADKPNVLRADPVVTVRKQRTRKYNVMYEATKEHPAQIDIVEIDEPVGEIRAYDWTGMISPGKKAALLLRTDELIEAVKTARARANSVQVDPDKKIAKRIFDHLMEPLG